MYDSTSMRDASMRGAGTLKVIDIKSQSYSYFIVAFVGTLVAAVRRKKFVCTVFL